MILLAEKVECVTRGVSIATINVSVDFSAPHVEVMKLLKDLAMSLRDIRLTGASSSRTQRCLALIPSRGRRSSIPCS